MLTKYRRHLSIATLGVVSLGAASLLTGCISTTRATPAMDTSMAPNIITLSGTYDKFCMPISRGAGIGPLGKRLVEAGYSTGTIAIGQASAGPGILFSGSNARTYSVGPGRPYVVLSEVQTSLGKGPACGVFENVPSALSRENYIKELSILNEQLVTHWWTTEGGGTGYHPYKSAMTNGFPTFDKSQRSFVKGDQVVKFDVFDGGVGGPVGLIMTRTKAF